VLQGRARAAVGRCARSGDRSATVKALPAIIEGIRKKGLRLELVEPRGEIALTHPRG